MADVGLSGGKWSRHDAMSWMMTLQASCVSVSSPVIASSRVKMVLLGGMRTPSLSYGLFRI